MWKIDSVSTSLNKKKIKLVTDFGKWVIARTYSTPPHRCVIGAVNLSFITYYSIIGILWSGPWRSKSPQWPNVIN